MSDPKEAPPETQTNPNPTAEIKLGDRSWVVRPLNIGQLETVLPALNRALSSDIVTKETFAASLEVIAAALARDFKDVTVDVLRDIETTDYRQITKAVKDIGVLCGLKFVEKDAPKGEAKAETPQQPPDPLTA